MPQLGDYEVDLASSFSLVLGSDTRRQVQQISLLAHQMAIRLPRELRDEVYSHLWDDDTVHKIDYLSPLAKKWCYQAKDRYGQTVCACDPTGLIKKKPLFVRPLVMSGLIAREVVESFYRNAKLELLPDQLRSFLSADIFHVGLKPEHCKIGNLRICQDFRSRAKPCGIRMGMSTVHLRSFLNQVQLAPACQIEIDLFGYHSYGTYEYPYRRDVRLSGISLLNKWIQMMGPVLTKLKATGSHLRVLFTSDRDSERLSFPCTTTYWDGLDVMDKLSYSRADWI